MSTNVKITYTAPTATGLTQTVTRTALTQTISPITLNTTTNYSQTYSATFAITSTAPTTVSLATSALNGYTFTRVGDTYTLTGKNNWAYFKRILRTLSIVTDNTLWPNPPLTIDTTITDGVTSLSGTITVPTLNASVPTTPTLTISGKYTGTITLSWTASTQTLGPVGGVAGYYVYKNGSSIPSATVTGGLLTWSELETNTDTSYIVKAFDSSSPEVLSSASNSVAYAYFVAAGTRSGTAGSPTVNPIYKSSNGSSWTTAYTPSIGTYGYTHRIAPDIGSLFVPIFSSSTGVYSNDGGATLAATFSSGMVGAMVGGFPAGLEFDTIQNGYKILTRNSSVDLARYNAGTVTGAQGSYVQTTLTYSNVYGANGIFVKRDDTGSKTNIYTSNNGTSWTSRISPEPTRALQGASGDDTNLTILGFSGSIFYSTTNYTSFNLISMPSTPYGLGSGLEELNRFIRFKNGIWISLTTSAGTVMSSPDAITWTNRSTGTGLTNGTLNYENNTWIVNQGGKLASSSDGITWTTITPSVSLVSTQEIKFCNGKYFTIASGNVYSSSDLTTWTSSYANANLYGQLALI